MRRVLRGVAESAPVTSPTVRHDFRGLPYCRLSARFADDGGDGWLVPEDFPLKRFAPEVTEEGLRQQLQEAFGVTGLELDPDSTDACLCAFGCGVEESWLASWDVYSQEDLVLVWDDLARALSLRRSSRLLAARIVGGRVLLHVGYRPIAANPRDLAVLRRSGELLDRLAAARRSGLRHGGINERWVSLSPCPRVFGFGLASLYAAWRRQQGAKLGFLVADPRFASPAELIGSPGSGCHDSFSLAALLTTSHLACQGAIIGMPRRVMGADAFLQQIAWSGERLPRLERTAPISARLVGWPPGSGVRRLAAALKGPVHDLRRAGLPGRLSGRAAVVTVAAAALAAVGLWLFHVRQRPSPTAASAANVDGGQSGTAISGSNGPGLVSARSLAELATGASLAAPTAAPPQVPAEGQEAPSEPGPASLAAGQAPLVVRIENPDEWLAAHLAELEEIAAACSPAATVVLVIGGQLPAPFIAALKEQLADFKGGHQPAVKLITDPPSRLPVLVVGCGAATNPRNNPARAVHRAGGPKKE